MRILLLCIASVTLLAIPSSAQLDNHVLPGESLNTSDALYEGVYDFIMQDDCNLVLHHYNSPVWASGTNNQGSYCYATLESDGNFVVYDFSNKTIWASDTNGENGNYILILQKDGNVVIRSMPIWEIGTNSSGSASVVIASPHNGSMLASGTQKNKVRKKLEILEVTE